MGTAQQCYEYAPRRASVALRGDSKRRDHLRLVKVARIGQDAGPVRDPDIRVRLVHRTRIPKAAGRRVLHEPNIVPADRRAELDDRFGVRRAKWLLLEEVVADVDLDHRRAILPAHLDLETNRDGLVGLDLD